MSGQRSMPQAMTLEADWLVTMAGPAIRGGRIAIEKGRIASVGPADEVPVIGPHIRLGEAVVLPGLINAHCHLELSAYHAALPARDLWGWLAGLVMLRLQPAAAEKEQAAVPAAVRSMLESGTTCVGDISRAPWLAGALARERMRKVCYVELISGAMSPPADIAQVRQRLDDLPEGDPLLHPGISPHAPYTVTREDLRACTELAQGRGIAMAIHLAETREEIEWLRSGTGRIAEWHARLFRNPPQSPRKGPSEYAIRAELGQGFAAALIHMNHADDWAQLCHVPREDRPVVVYCPRSHHFFGHEAHPVCEMLQAGLMVGIGTDSAASHDSGEIQPLSVLDEMRWLHVHRPDLPANRLLEMATVYGAAALGLSGITGQLVPGMQADLTVWELPKSDISDPTSVVFDGENMPSLVCVGGRIAWGSGDAAVRQVVSP